MSFGTHTYAGDITYAGLFAVGDLAVSEGATPIPDGETVPKDYSVHTLGDPEPTKTFTVENIGNSTINITSVTVPTGYAIVDGLPASLAPGNSDDLIVKLVTSSTGLFTGDIAIDSDDPDEDPYNWAITGKVIATALADAALKPKGLLRFNRRTLARLVLFTEDPFPERWHEDLPLKALNRLENP